jgi:ribosomal protein S18 acetylase RimI-like enzyme
MIIRDYNPDTDYAGLRACVVELQDFEYRIDPRYPDGESIVAEYIPDVLLRCRQYAGKIMVAELEGEIAGYAMVWSKVPGEDIEDGDFECGRLADLAVLEPFRGRGIGQRLIEASEAWALEKGVRYFRLGVMAKNGNARALYKKLGYEKCHIEMEKEL